jgi:hypothetical protein
MKKFNITMVTAFAVLSTYSHLSCAGSSGDVDAVVYSYRLSSFIDGKLIHNDRLPLSAVPKSPASIARSGVDISWAPNHFSKWSFGVFREASVWADGASGSVEALALVNNKGKATMDAEYPFDVQSESITRKGLMISQSLGSMNSHIFTDMSWSLRLFGIEKYRLTSALGYIRENANGTAGLQAQVVRTELGKSASFIPTTGAIGYGASVGFSLEGELEDTRWLLMVDDLSTPITLKSVLVTRTNYNTVDIKLDNNGIPDVASVAVGSYKNESVKIRSNPRWSLNMASRLNPAWRLNTGISSEKPFMQGFVGIARHHSWGAWATSLYFGNKDLPTSLSISIDYQDIHFQWRGDSLSPTDARVWFLLGSVRF